MEPEMVELPIVETDEKNDIKSDEVAELSKLYSVVMHNDPITTMDFVIEVLTRKFSYDMQGAFETMYRIHTLGFEKVALLPRDKAEQIVSLVHFSARENGYPLTCTIEAE